MKLTNKIKEHKQKSRRKRLERISRHIIQAQEYNGTLYFCYEGQPLLEVSELDLPLVQAIKSARKVWVEHNMER